MARVTKSGLNGIRTLTPVMQVKAPPVELPDQLGAGRMWVDYMIVDDGYRSVYILMHNIHIFTSYIHKSISIGKIKVVKIK